MRVGYVPLRLLQLHIRCHRNKRNPFFLVEIDFLNFLIKFMVSFGVTPKSVSVSPVEDPYNVFDFK